MNPSDEPNQPSDTSTNDWFNELPSPDIAPTEPSVKPPRSRKVIFLVAGSVLLILSVAVYALFTLTSSSVGACLTSNDYKSLTGKTADSQLSATESFYTASFTYGNGSSDFTGATKAESLSIIKNLGRFFAQHSKDTSVVITISGGYTPNDDKASATTRIAKLKHSLVQNGIPESYIKIEAPTKIISGGELDETSAELKNASAYLTITSESTCR